MDIGEFTAYFEKYGHIEDIAIICNKNSKEPRGFGFVTYSDNKSVELVLNEYQEHFIENKWVFYN